jgi:hypothetical protein
MQHAEEEHQKRYPISGERDTIVLQRFALCSKTMKKVRCGIDLESPFVDKQLVSLTEEQAQDQQKSQEANYPSELNAEEQIERWHLTRQRPLLLQHFLAMSS